MSFAYDNLWRILEERNMKKEDLRKATGISSATLAKLGKNENINMQSLEKICIALECDIGDIVKCKYDKEEKI
ncbi:MAG: helix-turn-helix transcriptional regulator [Epulopiscium sp.]|nr:helix-turn-helix transcriptional regulator [Candidatus Epulonipiscium sp.]